ncbi:MAG: DUF6597 domain-containing transcriptional factor [Janthinobacterium lividum]
MSYHEYLPHPALLPYIDAYWTIRTDDTARLELNRILPDGCTDLIFNKGNTVYGPGHRKVLLADQSYLIGMMTTFSETLLAAENSLLGIRFKAGGIAAFYRLNVHEITDLAVPYQDNELRELVYQSPDLLADLNLYFRKKLPLHPLPVAAVIAEISSSTGRIKVLNLLNGTP